MTTIRTTALEHVQESVRGPARERQAPAISIHARDPAGIRVADRSGSSVRASCLGWQAGLEGGRAAMERPSGWAVHR